MNILDICIDFGLNPNRKASSHGGEYSSPCPFCKDGDDRFIIQPMRHNNNGENGGGRFSCRVCGKYGDAITFLRLLYGMTYLEACARLRIEPKERNNLSVPRSNVAPKLRIADEPADSWKEKATAFVEWSHNQLLNSQAGMKLIRDRGFNEDSIALFKLGYNPQNFFRERIDWGLAREVKDDGKVRKLWLPAGVVIPTISDGNIIKVKVRRSEWKEGENLPKYVEISGSKQMPSIYGNTSLPCALVVESELDALLIQQEAGDLVYCVALGGSTKPLDAYTDQLLRSSQLILFLPDFDKAGATAWVKWKKMFPNIQRILTPCEKSAGDYFLVGGDLREWLSESVNEIFRKLNMT